MKLEVLLVKDSGNSWKVIGTHIDGDLLDDSSCKTLNASNTTLELVREYISSGRDVFIPKTFNGNEVHQSDLVIQETDELETYKNIAISTVNNRIHENIVAMSIIDAMDYLDSYMKLLAGGIFITDSNREDKYFEIIETAQETEEPVEPGEGATFQEERKFIEDKKKYNVAQENLRTLETYLNSYDKVSKIRFVNNLLNTAKNNIEKCESKEEVDSAVKEYEDKVNSHFYV